MAANGNSNAQEELPPISMVANDLLALANHNPDAVERLIAQYKQFFVGKVNVILNNFSIVIQFIFQQLSQLNQDIRTYCDNVGIRLHPFDQMEAKIQGFEIFRNTFVI